MQKGWLIVTKCNNPNHSHNMHLFIENVCGKLTDTEVFPNGDSVGHTYGSECVCKPSVDGDLLYHNALYIDAKAKIAKLVDVIHESL